MNCQDIRVKMCEIGELMYRNHLAIANDGNISVRVAEDEFLITPTRVCKKDLKPEMMVRVNLAGEILSGDYRPSTEVKMHIKVYELRPELNVVIHTHSPFATAFATAGRALDRITVPSAYCFLGKVPVTEYGTASTEELPNSVAKLIGGNDVMLLKNHGALLTGKELEETYFKAERLELYAQITLYSELLGGARELNEEEVSHLNEKKKSQKKMGLL